jgi:type II restriction enzyme
MKTYLTKFTGSKSATQRKIINQALNILDAFGIPVEKTDRRLEMMALCFLSLADVSKPKDWKNSKDIHKRSLKSRDIINWINDNFDEKISSGSYDDIRRKHLLHILMGDVAIHSNLNSARNNPTRGYGINPSFLPPISSYSPKGKGWDKIAGNFMKNKSSLVKKLSGNRVIKTIPVSLPGGKKLNFSPGEHNELQKSIIEVLLSKFCPPPAEVLYVGDTTDKYLCIDKKKLKAINFFEIRHGELPDVIAISESKNWLFLIEAVHSTGPMSPERVIELKKITEDCSAEIIFITAFLDKKTFKKWAAQIAWETEVWIADNPDHMIHFNGEKFLGPYCG